MGEADQATGGNQVDSATFYQESTPMHATNARVPLLQRGREEQGEEPRRKEELAPLEGVFAKTRAREMTSTRNRDANGRIRGGVHQDVSKSTK